MLDGRTRITDYPILIGLMSFNPKGIEFYKTASHGWVAYVLAHNHEQLQQLEAFCLVNDKRLLDMPLLNGVSVGTLTIKVQI